MNKEKEILYNCITQDFQVMKSMLDDIELSLMQNTPLEQIAFYRPIQTMILYAWEERGGYKQDYIKDILKTWED